MILQIHNKISYFLEILLKKFLGRFATDFFSKKNSILLKKFGNLKATKKTSAISPAPTIVAINMSLINPSILLTNVNELTVIKGLINFIQ